MDPRVTAGVGEIALQTRTSMQVYETYLRLQQLRERIDGQLDDDSGNPPEREALTALRGRGAPGLQDITYGSIYAATDAEETVVGLQDKLLFALEILQSADARPTSQTLAAVRQLRATARALKRRFEALDTRN
jgi:hypothetical protein